LIMKKTKIKPIDIDNNVFTVTRMEGYQLEVYNKYIDKTPDPQTLVQISNICYPTETDNINYRKGKSGFFQVFSEKETRDKRLVVEYIDKKKQIMSLKNIGVYSSKIKTIIDSVMSSNGLVLLYSKYLWSGVIPMAIALEHAGFSKYNNSNILSDKNLVRDKGAYIILSGTELLTSKKNIDKKEELSIFNSNDNMYGDQIRIAIINEVATEGVTFKNVRDIHILEPWHNMNRIKQIIGRGVRYKSHHKLPTEMRNVRVHLHMNTNDTSSVETVDYRRYRKSIIKQTRITQVENILKINSIDCQLNNDVNSVKKGVKTMVDPDGKELRYEQVSFGQECKTQVDVDMQKLPVSSNTRMLLFDIIEVCNDIKYWITQREQVSFTLDEIAIDIKTDLLENSLKYIVKNKIEFTMGLVIVFIIRVDDIYLVQPVDVTDTRITISERKTPKKNFVSKYSISLPTEPTKDTEVNLFETIDFKIDEIVSEFENRYNSVDREVVVDMVIDVSSSDEHMQFAKNIGILKKKYSHIYKSLVRGHYVIPEEKVYYDVYEKAFLTYDMKHCPLVKTEQMRIKTLSNLKTDVNRLKGFIKLDPKSNTMALAIKHKDMEKSKGSVCLSTASFTVNVMKQYIEDISPLEKDYVNRKPMLCKIYEYVLRKEGNFMRPVEYMFKKTTK
jgi:hypothetical protein